RSEARGPPRRHTKKGSPGRAASDGVITSHRDDCENSEVVVNDDDLVVVDEVLPPAILRINLHQHGRYLYHRDGAGNYGPNAYGEVDAVYAGAFCDHRLPNSGALLRRQSRASSRLAGARRSLTGLATARLNLPLTLNALLR